MNEERKTGAYFLCQPSVLVRRACLLCGFFMGTQLAALGSKCCSLPLGPLRGPGKRRAQFTGLRSNSKSPLLCRKGAGGRRGGPPAAFAVSAFFVGGTEKNQRCYLKALSNVTLRIKEETKFQTGDDQFACVPLEQVSVYVLQRSPQTRVVGSRGLLVYLHFRGTRESPPPYKESPWRFVLRSPFCCITEVVISHSPAANKILNSNVWLDARTATLFCQLSLSTLHSSILSIEAAAANCILLKWKIKIKVT